MKTCENMNNLLFLFNSKKLDSSLTLSKAGLSNESIILVIDLQPMEGGGGAWYEKKINIKFIKVSENFYNKPTNCKLLSLLKLCLLKEIAYQIDYNKLNKLPELIYYIMRILINGYIEGKDDDVKKSIKDILGKTEGSNLINFSNYVDETINSEQIDNILKLLNKDKLKEIKDIQYRLSKYNEYIKLFDSEFERAKKESIFEFSAISLVIIERQDFEKFKQEREKCPNRVEKILYHGTSIEPISCILTGLFKKSIDRCCQHGKGVYFTDLLDYCWFYGGEVSNRANKNKIPKINETFTLIACSIYYNKNGFNKVIDYKKTPKKNEINFAYAGAKLETLIEPDKSKFYGTEYVIWDLDQICPFMSIKLKRDEFCVIWRDNNFSPNPIYNNEFDEKFKKFLKERMKYIKQTARYNIYPCESSEDALELIKRKKYNKIILISNVGKDLGGKQFIENARRIIGNDVITLFLAYKISHLDWIKNYKNALFSNEPKFYEEYLECFNDNKNYYDNDTLEKKIRSLIVKMEKHYDVKFNFNNNFLYYPHFKGQGNYSDLSF